MVKTIDIGIEYVHVLHIYSFILNGDFVFSNRRFIFALYRYYSTLKEFIGGREDAQLTILRTLYETWKFNGQVYFEKLFAFKSVGS